ncbi:MAG: FeoB-associated Cys-rich membrane protein [Desulfosalsimonas sp.]
MIQEIIVFAIVAAALGFTVRGIYRRLASKQPDCACGCEGCRQAGHCDQEL